MIAFLSELKNRNEVLFYFGSICLVLAILFISLTKIYSTQVYNVNAWYKPFKFARSTWLFAWAMAWYCYYLPHFKVQYFNWTVIILLGFEILYIAIQAGRGQLSHYNTTTPFYSTLYGMMALAATLVTLYTAYIGLLFFTSDFPALQPYYVWSIRFGLLIFVVFSFEGFVMGSRLSHTIGGEDGGVGIPILNWSTQYGDPRIAHFIGMHALQVLPIMAYFVLKNTKTTFLMAFLYGVLAVFTLVQALAGEPLIKSKPRQTEVIK